MTITARELAKKLNLSATAVSMALNNKPGVSTNTRNLVIKEAEKYGYDFSKLALKKNKEGEIYCIIYRAHNAILNYTPIFEKSDDLQKFIEDMQIVDCVGIILLATEITPSVCNQFRKLSVPIILLDSYFDSVDCSSVIINNAQGAYLATNYLIDRTGKQPGHLSSSYKIKNFTERKRGVHQAIREHGMSVGKSVLHELSPSIDGAFSDMLEIIDSGDDLAECYFADNDLIAIGAIKALKLRGYKVPQDVAIIGFDNISEGRVIDPSLTTVDIPRKFMGQTATSQLIKQLLMPVPHTVKIEVSTTVVKRFSV